MKGKTTVLLISLLVCCGFAGGIGIVNAASKPYKIGFVLALTGPYAFLGEPERKAAILVAEEINKAGGIDGHPIELVVVDSQTDASKAVTALKKLLMDSEILAVCGGSSSPENLAMIPVIESEGIPFMSCGGAVQISDPVKKWVFQMPQTDRIAMAALLKYFKMKNLSKIAMLHSSGGWGQSGMERLKEQAPGAGMTILGQETFNDKDVDMTTQLSKLRALNPEVLLTWTAAPAGAIVSKNVKQLGISCLHAHDHGFGNKKYLEMAGEAANGDVFPMGKILVAEQLDVADPQKQVLVSFVKKYEERWKEPVASFCAHTHDGLQMVAAALKSVGPDRSKIRDAIEKMHFVGCNGVFNFSEKDHNGLDETSMAMVRVENETWKVIKK